MGAMILNENSVKSMRRQHLFNEVVTNLYDSISSLTSDICKTPVCIISMADGRHWCESKIDLDVTDIPTLQKICAHTIYENSYVEIYDTFLDVRTIKNKLCMGQNPLRFYAGELLRSSTGFPIGTLSILDVKPRRLGEMEKKLLNLHAEYISSLSGFRETFYKHIFPARGGKNSIGQTVEKNRSTAILFETLTPREKEITHLIVKNSGNMTSKQIAENLGISHRTVDHHRAHILRKMRVQSVTELTVICLVENLFDDLVE